MLFCSLRPIGAEIDQHGIVDIANKELKLLRLRLSRLSHDKSITVAVGNFGQTAMKILPIKSN